MHTCEIIHAFERLASHHMAELIDVKAFTSWQVLFADMLCAEHSPTDLCRNHVTCFAVFIFSMVPGNSSSQLEILPRSTVIHCAKEHH